MKILAIETSCDETAISAMNASGGFKKPHFEILSNVIASQIKIHAKWGGVVPNLAKREHQANLIPVLKKALREANLLISNSKFPISKKVPKFKIQIPNIEIVLEREPLLKEQFLKFVQRYAPPKIDVIAVTVGPGLEPALWVGINFAKALALLWQKPVIPINHMEGHLLSVLLKQNRKENTKFQNPKIEFPAVALLVSGGHTELVLVKDWLKYNVIGQTLDDAAGEAFDKAAKMLGLGYPGGPVIAALAAKCQMSNVKFQIKLPRPMINSKNYNFSFSGLKTAVLYLIRDLTKQGYKLSKFQSAVAAEFQQAIIDVLISKTIRAAKEYKAKTIILGGGVAANQELRKQFQQKLKKENSSFRFQASGFRFCTDNAAMIAVAGYFHAFKQHYMDWKNLRANANLQL